MGFRPQPFRVWEITFGKVGRKTQDGVEQYGKWYVYGQKKFVQLYLWRALAGSYGVDVIGEPNILLMGESAATMTSGLTMSYPRPVKKVWLHKVYFGSNESYGRVWGQHIEFIQEFKPEAKK